MVVTGGAGDAALARALGEGLPRPVIDLAGRLSVAETMAVIGALDLFLSPDTGPMHMACAMGTPSVAVFGPSAAERYFSAEPVAEARAPRGGAPRAVVRALQPHPHGRPRSAWPTSPRSACGSSPWTTSTPRPPGSCSAAERMKTLVLWGDGGVEAARARHEDGAALLLWDGERSTALDAAGIPYRAAASLTAGAQDEIDEAAMAWTKEWGRRPLLDGRSFRELFAWKGVSLWWFAELYLHHSTDAPRHVRVIESVHRILDAETPDEVETVGLSPEDTLLVERTCTARGVLFHGPRRLTRFPAARKVAAVVRAAAGTRPRRC